ncbi:N-acetylglucosamine kinase [Pseudonocardia parietis]|uniref:N-acetylglucosamine kinase-like BadF-type ATPase n=1 Tax=Pseudonocardia parietis TaxID=570936 RepID=A0ABS4VWQ9_9PSEU|nr:BadF/BadG/BcrA/BcrD ATPase family protein [Pseudonocardia parietis]MBP2368365.1 N-acetylglucosamine kinase-like BadF-type ATPase [Pseudonocardia parietis]
MTSDGGAMTRLFALDVGKTGCRAVLVEGGARVATGRWAGAGGIADRDGVVRALAAIAGATDGWPTPDAVGAGLAGLASAPQRATDLADGLRARFGPALRVLLTSDMTTWHAGALGGGPGVVLAVGTGSVALGVDGDGSHARVDGWGHLLGDDGSGHAIGRAGLAAALRAHDGRPGGSPALLTLLRARFGDPDGLPARVHGSDNPAREIAAFARDVLGAASGGNPVAGTIVARAATALADTAAAARDRLPGADPAGGTRVACGGGLLDAGAVLTGPLDTALAARGLTRTRPLGDALDGARLLLEDPTVPHHALLVPVAGSLR